VAESRPATNRVRSIDLGWRARTRPPSLAAHVLAAGAGAFAVAATVALAIEITSTDATAPGVLLDLALAAVAFAAGMRLPGPVRSAAVAALALTNPLIWFFAFYGGGSGGTSGLRGLYLLSIAAYLVLYVVKWTRGRAVFLALLLLFVASWIQLEIGSSSGTVLPFQSQIQSNPFGTHVSSSSSGLFGLGHNAGDDVATVALVLGLAYLAIAAVLDRRRYVGAALAFIVIGAIEGIAGAIALGANEHSVTLGGLLAALVGAVLVAIGALGEARRGSIWIGVLAIVGGLVFVIGDAADSTLGFAGYAALIAIGLLGTSLILTARLHEPPDGGEPAGT
jgi:hypothetical protein